MLGIEQIGLAALIERYFAVTIGKAGQKSDWSRRPLSERQLSYAVNDTRYLEALSEQLAGELVERGRIEWHRESCRAMVQSTGTGSCTRYRKTPGASKARVGSPDASLPICASSGVGAMIEPVPPICRHLKFLATSKFSS